MSGDILTSTTVENNPQYPPFIPGDNISRTGWGIGDVTLGEVPGSARLWAYSYPVSDMSIGTWSSGFLGNKTRKWRRWRYRFGDIKTTVSDRGGGVNGGGSPDLAYTAPNIPGDVNSWQFFSMSPSTVSWFTASGNETVRGLVSPWFEYDLTDAELPLLKVRINCSASSQFIGFNIASRTDVILNPTTIETDDDLMSLFLTRNSAVKPPDPPTKLCKWGY